MAERILIGRSGFFFLFLPCAIHTKKMRSIPNLFSESFFVMISSLVNFLLHKFLYENVTIQPCHLLVIKRHENMSRQQMVENERNQRYTQYVGLFGEIEGRVNRITLLNPVLSLEILPDKEYSFDYLCGAGIVCGRSQGVLEDIAVTVSNDKREQDTVRVLCPERPAETEKDSFGVGGIVGILAAAQDGNGALKVLDRAAGAGQPAWELVMEGKVTAILPEPGRNSEESEGPEEKAAGMALGVGGIFGYGWTGKGVTLTYCQNRGDVTANLFAGGIGGRMTGIYESGTFGEERRKCSGYKELYQQRAGSVLPGGRT